MFRRFCIGVGVLALAACSHGPRGRAQALSHSSGDRLNVVLILAEDLGPHLGAYGDPVARTPRLDQMAREGILFANAFTTVPVCAPSRATVQTGMYPRSIGAMHMRTDDGFDPSATPPTFVYRAVPPPEVKAFPELMRRAGYFTANHLKTDYQFGEPFTIWDTFDKEESHRTVWRNAPAGQPFLAMLDPWVTHESVLWPPNLKSKDRAWKAVAARNAKLFAEHPSVIDPNAVHVSPYLADTPNTRRDVARQYDNATILDEQVGEILDALGADGVLDHTIVIFATDHGDGLPNAKRRAYDAGLHVPLIVRFPDGRGAGTVRQDPVSFVDLAPTILDLVGLDIPPSMQGQSFLGPHARERQYAFGFADRMDETLGKWRSVRDVRFQYLANEMPDLPLFQRVKYREALLSMQDLWRLHAHHALTPLQESQFTTPRPREELYDVVADPDETKNLAGDPAYAADLARLRAALADFEAKTPDLCPDSERAMAERMWPGLVQPKTAPPVVAHVTQDGVDAVALRSPTPGASLGYRFPDDPPRRWRLYVAPIPAPPGLALEAKAVRYGYAESETIEVH